MLKTAFSEYLLKKKSGGGKNYGADFEGWKSLLRTALTFLKCQQLNK
jgi:hypothetical protein